MVIGLKVPFRFHFVAFSDKKQLEYEVSFESLEVVYLCLLRDGRVFDGRLLTLFALLTAYLNLRKGLSPRL